MISVKFTAAGAPAYTFDEMTGDPWLVQGERLHDRPNLDAVNGDLDRLSHLYDGLAIDAGAGTPVPIGTPDNAAQHDARFELESEMRSRPMFGPTNGDPLQHGHIMPTTLENFTRYTGGEERTAITNAHVEQQEFQDDLWAEYQARWPQLAADPAATAAAIAYEMNHLRWHDELPERYVRQHRDDFLRNVATNQSAGLGRRESAYEDSNRTYGITTGGTSAARQPRPEDRMTDSDWHIEWQRQRKIY
jgi:hypothetical protein